MFWECGELPQDFKDAFIITIYKKKGNCQDCDNYHGISLPSIADKILDKVMLKPLQTLVLDILPES